jgi:hypothetical protein
VHGKADTKPIQHPSSQQQPIPPPPMLPKNLKPPAPQPKTPALTQGDPPACMAKPTPSPYSTLAASSTSRFGETPSSVALTPYSTAATLAVLHPYQCAISAPDAQDTVRSSN